MSRGFFALRAVALTLVGLGAVAGCSSDDDPSASTSESVPASSTPTSAAPIEAAFDTEQAVGGAYRQGVARAPEGWLFSTNQALYLTDEDYERTVENTAAIPDDLMASGYDHIGDADLVDGVVYAPLEQPNYDRDEQMMLRFDAETLEFLDGAPVGQSHNAWVSVDDGVAYSMSAFSDDVVLRYDLPDWQPLEPLALSEQVERVQGGDVLDGALWLSTDDEVDGLYRVDLGTGAVTEVGALTHVDGEGEGVDATSLPSGDLHALSVDVALAPVWFQHFRLE